MSENYCSFETLIATDRVAKRISGRWGKVAFAGYSREDGRRTVALEFPDKKTAKRAVNSLKIHIAEKRACGECVTDIQYNEILDSWIDQLIEGGYIKESQGAE